MHYLLSLLVFVFLMASCVTTEEPYPVVQARQSSDRDFISCRNSIQKCSKSSAATFCFADVQVASSFDSVVEGESQVQASNNNLKVKLHLAHLYSWGLNKCDAMNKMNNLFCKNKMDAPQKGWVTCQPDASNGHCPVLDKKCELASKPVVCFAGYYGEQAMPSPHALTAKGANECEAKKALFKAACRKNFDPLRLRRINCEEDQIQIKNNK
jgi:hypothetical protein